MPHKKCLHYRKRNIQNNNEVDIELLASKLLIVKSNSIWRGSSLFSGICVNMNSEWDNFANDGLRDGYPRVRPAKNSTTVAIMSSRVAIKRTTRDANKVSIAGSSSSGRDSSVSVGC